MIYTYDIYEREPKIVRQYYRQHKKIFSNTYQSTSAVYSIGQNNIFTPIQFVYNPKKAATAGIVAYCNGVLHIDLHISRMPLGEDDTADEVIVADDRTQKFDVLIFALSLHLTLRNCSCLH